MSRLTALTSTPIVATSVQRTEIITTKTGKVGYLQFNIQ